MDHVTDTREAHRLAALYDLGILDTEAEQAFDDLTALAAAICETPISAVSLVDHDRQWFKSIVGLDVSETPRDVAFCNHAIQKPDEVLVVEDATADSRFKDNALVTSDPNIRFYAGAPMRISGGHALGTLCVIDRKPRKLSESQIRSLHVLSRQVANNLELVKANKQLAARNEELDQFAYRVAHDVRAPLTSSRCLAECIIEDIDNADYSEARRNVGNIIRQMDKLDTLTGALLDLTKADLAEIKTEKIDFGDMLDSVVAAHQEMFEQNKVELVSQIDSKGSILLPKVRIQQILSNLVSNSLKYHNPNQQDRFIKLIWRENEDGVDFQVLDNGLGIPESCRKNIFELFQRFHPGQASGTGLGLAIVKKHIDAMHATIKVDTNESGTVFSMWIPRTNQAHTTG